MSDPRLSDALPKGPVLLVGGGGFLGTNLAARLASAGVEVISYSRSWLAPDTQPLIRRFTARAESAGDDLMGLAREASCVFQMAHSASPASPVETMAGDLTRSMELNFAVMQASERAEIPMVYLSSGGAIYGQVDQIPTPETAPTLPISPYGAAKLTAERYMALRGRLCGLDYRVVRISNPYGPWQLGQRGQGVIGRWMRLIRQGQSLELWGDGTMVRDYLFVSDVTDALLAALQDVARHQIYNVGSGTGISLNDILEHLRHICGDEAVRVVYRETAPSHLPVSILDTTKAARDLNWSPRVSMVEGLAQSWNWMSNRTDMTG